MTTSVTSVVRIDRQGRLGYGGYGNVCKAFNEASGAVIACKATRTSLRLKRPPLRYEARVLQLLQGHISIPKLVGYSRVEHFEFLGLELLGKELKAMLQPGHAIKPGTVLRVGEQLLSALEHLYAHNIVHRDVKSANILVSPSEPERIVLIDFGLARRLSAEEMLSPGPKFYDPFEDRRDIMGTPDWCSLNAYQGRALRPCDDLESLGYVLFFLFFGNLPWRGIYEQDGRNESQMHAMMRIYATKQAFSRMLPFASAPPTLNKLLQVAQAFTNGDLRPCLRDLREEMRSHIDESGDHGPLNWDPVPAPSDIPTITLSPSVFHGIPLFDDVNDKPCLPSGTPTYSYFRITHLEMTIQRERDVTLTLMADESEVQKLDSQILPLGDIYGWSNGSDFISSILP